MGFFGFLKNKCDICGKKGNLKKKDLKDLNVTFM
jgi:hypothetical protein